MIFIVAIHSWSLFSYNIGRSSVISMFYQDPILEMALNRNSYNSIFIDSFDNDDEAELKMLNRLPMTLLEV